MIPSVLSTQLVQGVKGFLATTFPSTTLTFSALWAVKLFSNNEIDNLDNGVDDQQDYKSLYHGPKPEIKIFETINDELAAIKNHIMENPRNYCRFYRRRGNA